jgi:trimeric autotransporter adhesin
MDRGAFMLGGTASDALVGGSKADLLVGNAGDDVLQGRGGNDLLLGGTGTDTYIYQAGDGLDTILDRDGNGSILMNGQTLAGGAQYGDSRVSRDALGRVYTNVGGGRLVIDGNIIIEGWSAGKLGLNMTGSPAVVPADNYVAGTSQSNTLTGTGAADQVEGYESSDILIGGMGNDRIYGDAQVSDADAIASGNAPLGSVSRGDWLTGGGGDDTIVGSAASDVLMGGGGKDLLIGGAGDDDIRGDGDWTAANYSWTVYWEIVGVNSTRVYTSTTAEGTLYPQDAAADLIYGGSGDDTVFAGAGNDVVFGEDDRDTLFGADGNDVLIGGKGNDSLNGESGDDFLDGGANDDYLLGHEGDDILIGGTGDDYLIGGPGSDVYVYNLGDGKDRIVDILDQPGNVGDKNILRFGIGVDPANVKLGLGSLLLDLGNGDQVHIDNFNPDDVYNSCSIDSFEFADGTTLSVRELLERGFDIVGTELADLLEGTNVTDRIVGLGGNDSLYGLAGNDHLLGGEGADVLWGDDLVSLLALQFHGDDYLDGGAGWDVLYGGGGSDTLSGGAGSDTLFGEDGDDAMYGGVDNDYMYGGNGNNLLDGGDANDRLEGGAGNDVLLGGAGNDMILTNGGNDTVDGEGGVDTLFADGSGITTVLFGRGSGQDALYWNPAQGGTINLRFKEGLAASDLVSYRRQVNPSQATLSIGLAGSADFIELVNYPFADAPIPGTYNPIDMRFADGTVFTPVLLDIGQYVKQIWNSSSSVTTTGTSTSDILYVSSNQSTTLFGGSGDDVLIGTSTDIIFGDVGINNLFGEDGNDFILGGERSETLDGGAGDDTLDGNLGGAYDHLYGGAGSNTYVFGKGYLSDQIFADRPSGGADTQTLILKDINPAEVVLTRLTNEVVDDLQIAVVGTPDVLKVNKFFMPDSGAATDFSIDMIKFADGTVWSYADIVAHIASEDQVIAGEENIFDYLIGGSGNDILHGLGQGDVLKGGAGNDLMVGGTGDDKYYVRDAGDQTIELADEGIDRVNAYLSWTLGANIENLILEDPVISSLDTNGTGNELNNTITGNAGNNVLDGGLGADSLAGGLGNDSYYIDDAADVVTEYLDEGVDAVFSSITKTLGANLENLTLIGVANINATGNSLDNVLSGNSGNNTLNGGTGADTMQGGAGNDTYTVDNVGDVVVELAGEGTDTVNASVSYTLSTDVENLTLTGTSALSGSGNALANVLTGNSGANALTGGAGNDTYVVGTGDTTVELLDEGVDTVQSAITWTLMSNLENLTLTGSSAIAGTGNGLGNVLTGNSGANVLTGGAGDDTYVVGTGDTTIELTGGGTDTVQSGITWTLATEVENLTLTGSSAINGTGNTGANVLAGNSAANTLTGLAGDDKYLFGLGGGADRVVDSAGNDRIVFGAGVTSGQITATRTGSVVKLALNASDSISIDDLGGGVYAVEQFEFAGGSVLGAAWLNSILPSAAPTATNLSAAEAYTEDAARNLVDIVVADADSANTTVTLTLSNLAAGSFNTGTSGTVTSTYNAATGVWTASGAIASVNTLLAALTFTPTANFNGNFTVATSVTDGVNPAVTGSKAFTGTKVNDVSTGTVTISGIAAQTQTLTASHTLADVDGLGAITYQWKAAGVNIAGATASTLVLGSTHVGKAITVSASFTDGGGTAESKTSAATASVIASVTGTTAANTLSGTTGAELMIGLAGNDTYVVNNAGDLVLENLNEGTDLVNASVTHTLAANVENITLTGTTAINGTGNTDGNVLTGNSGANTLTGLAGNDTLDGKAGADSLVGGTGNDTYWLGRGYGIDTITETDATAGNTDIARFEASVATNQLWFRQVSNNLEVSIIGTSDKFNIANWYTGTANHVEQFKTSDGKTLLDSQVQNLVSAMAAFAPPAAGQTTLPANYATALAPVIAANWV